MLKLIVRVCLIGAVLWAPACKKQAAAPAAASATASTPATLQEPTGITATVDSATQVTLSWNSGGGTTAGFTIAYQTGATAPANCDLGTTIHPSQIDGTSKTIPALTRETLYSFRICAIDSNLPPTVSSGITVSARPADAIAANPSGLTATVNSTTQITLNWASGGGTTFGYRIAYQSGATAPATCALGTTIAEGAISGTSKAVSGLNAGTQYSFRVCAINSNTPADASSGVTASATTSYAVAPNPTGLSATVNSTMQITLSWSSGGAGTVGYRIAYQTGAAAPATCALGTTIAEGAITGTSKAINGLIGGTQYSFRVCAINANTPVDVSSGVTASATTDAPFVSVWRTTSPGESITLPLRSGFTYNFTVNWGDGTGNSTVTAFNDPDITHSYASTGLHTVTITGVVQAWYFNGGGSNLNLIQVTDLGSVGWVALKSAFNGCSNLTTFAGGATASVTDMAQMFYGASALTSLNVTSFNTSAVTDMSDMFVSTSSLTSLDLSSFNTSNVTGMGGMFAEASALTTLNLSNFNTTNVTSMVGMFFNDAALTSLNLSSFNTTSVSNMAQMFYGVSGLNTLNLSSFVTTNVTNMAQMFFGMTNLSSLDISNFSTANVLDMSWMFAGTALTSINLSHFNTTSATDIGRMFYYCTALTSVNLSSFNTTSVTSMREMFAGDSSLTALDLSNFNTANVTSMDNMFDSTIGLLTLNANGWNVTLAAGSLDVFLNTNAGLVVTCDQGGPPGTGNLFGQTCH